MIRVLCIGGCHWDARLRLLAPLQEGQSSPVASSRQAGGVALNVARHLRAQQLRADIASVVGADAPETGTYITQFPDQPSARYLAIEDESGQTLFGLADMEIYQKMDLGWFASLSARLDDFDAVVVDSNASSEALSGLAFAGRTYAAATSPAKVRHLQGLRSEPTMVFCNQREFEVLANQERAFQTLVVTDGENPVRVGAGDDFTSIPVADVQRANSLGLGDRLAALVIARNLRGMEPVKAVADSLEVL